MNELDPLIEQLSNCRSHVERADWLKACPMGFLRRYDFTIRNRLMLAGCVMGVAYLDDLRVHMEAVRDPETGQFTAATQENIAALGSMLTAWAGVTDDAAAQRAEQPDHSITEL